MSETYRDDTHEIARAADTTWLGTRFVTEEMGRGRDLVLSAVLLLVADVAMAQDAVFDRLQAVTTEQAVGGNLVRDKLRAGVLVNERARGLDLMPAKTRALVVEAGTGSDAIVTGARSVLTEQARAVDTVLGQRHVLSQVAESAHAWDDVLSVQRTMVAEAGQALELVQGRMRAREQLAEVATGRDELDGAGRAKVQPMQELGQGHDAVLDHLQAAQLVADHPAVGWDEVLQQGAGQAWTAAADGWGMSRFAPFSFNGLAVIDGKLYATNEQGVHELTGTQETMQAHLQTGAIDMTGGVLAHLVDSYLSYELDGAAALTVTQTHGGEEAQSYTYALPGKPAAVLTTGRFILGRGLRGRHFAYTLTLTGQHAYINDWTFTVAPSKRSI